MRALQSEIIAALGVKPEIDPAEEVARRVQFLVDYLHTTHARGLVLGISGGVDSTVGGRLCQLAVEQYRAEQGTSAEQPVDPETDVVFTAMRLPYREQHDEDDAQAALTFIRPDRTVTVQIGPSAEELADAYREDTGEKFSDFNFGNVKARLRMVAQYAAAGQRGDLVVGTDHAAESITGFYTKFGDGSADVMPLAGLNKTQVRQLAQYLGADERLWAKVPTADLLSENPGRTDEDELGISYEHIDTYLTGGDIPPEAAEHLEGMYLRSRHKRTTPVTPQDDWWRDEF